MNYTHGDILQADVEAIVNTVNCVGVMGRGLALQFKKAWPENFRAYKQACDAKDVKPGSMFVFDTQQLSNPRYIVNFPTKRHWRGASRSPSKKRLNTLWGISSLLIYECTNPHAAESGCLRQDKLE